MIRTVVRLVVFICVPAILAALRPTPVLAQAVPCEAALPPNIRASPLFDPVIAILLRESETFRRQCRAIASSRHVRVFVAAGPVSRTSAARASATIARYSTGLLRADIEIPLLADYVELIPHELEHVLEQVEGLDLPALARARDPRAVALRNGVFETPRARAAGLAAVDDVYREPDPALTGAGRGLGRAWRALRSRAVRASVQTSSLRR